MGFFGSRALFPSSPRRPHRSDDWRCEGDIGGGCRGRWAAADKVGGGGAGGDPIVAASLEEEHSNHTNSYVEISLFCRFYCL